MSKHMQIVDLRLEDESNDRLYFTMVPNYILNHSSAIDQALYLQMKRFAGEKSGGGYCSASKRTLMERLKIGVKALNSSIDYLLEHKWIENIGTRKVMTDGGAQDIQVYRVNDIWKLNTDFYRGASESTPLKEGAAESTQGADERRKGASESTTTKNIYKYKESELSVRVVSGKDELTENTEPANTRDGFEDGYKELCEWAERRRGAKFIGRGKQFRHLKRARVNKIGPAQLKKRWQELEQDDWRDGLDWASVVSSFDKRPARV